MSPSRVRLNERSWAIDAISYGNNFLNSRDLYIRRLGGENSISGEGTRFPDLLLFSDDSKSIILQGWELKLPDTPIEDPAFLLDARRKSDLLGSDSFVVWNANEAALYRRTDTGFDKLESWGPIGLLTRDDVERHPEKWQNLLERILEGVDRYFTSDELLGVSFAESFEIISARLIIRQYQNQVGSSLKATAAKRRNFRLQCQAWWVDKNQEFQENEPWIPLAKNVMLHWVNRFIMAHVLKRHSVTARGVDKLDIDATPEVASKLFKDVISKFDFHNVFSDHFASQYVGSVAWRAILEFNNYLKDVNLEQVPDEYIQQILEKMVTPNNRKANGLFATPRELALLVANLTIEDYNKPILDPCCGSGMLLKQYYDASVRLGVSKSEALSNVWGLDKHTFPVQLSTIHIIDPDTVSHLIKITQQDFLQLTPGDDLFFQDPSSGQTIRKQASEYSAILMNPPYIISREIPKDDPGVKNVEDFMAEYNIQFNQRRDYYAYFPIYARRFLADDGYLGVIMPNAWLGTEYGEQLWAALDKFYDTIAIITSGYGRWFDTTDVVTNVVILKKSDVTAKSHKIQFVTTTIPLSEIKPGDVSMAIYQGKEINSIKVVSYGKENLERIGSLGIPYSSCFADMSFLNDLSEYLVPITSVFEVRRGERRGCNKLFYPRGDHHIEQKYLVPALKNLGSATGYVIEPNAFAFVCNCEKEELESLGHKGALDWINRFEGQTNTAGKPLVEELKKPGLGWYQFGPYKPANFVFNVNPYKRFFVAMIENPVLIDQRLAVLHPKDEGEDLDLLHALLNSIVNLFMITAIGFGRGLGVLDLTPTKYRKVRFLDPSVLVDDSRRRIKEAFSKVVDRGILELEEDLSSEERVMFDRIVLEEYGLVHLYEGIKNSLLHLYRIRMAVSD